MGELYSQYESGAQFTAGGIVGSYDGVSGINPLVDRLNKSFPDDFEYTFIDSTPSFAGLTYSSAGIPLAGSFYSCKIKGCVASSGTGSVSWQLYGVSAGAGADISSSGAITYDSAAGVMTFDGANLISTGWSNDQIYFHDGTSINTMTGSYDSVSNIEQVGLAYDNNTGNLLELNSGYVYTHNGLTSAITGSFRTLADIGGEYSKSMTFDGTNLWSGEIVGIYSGCFIHKHQGISQTELGSVQMPWPRARAVGDLAFDGTNIFALCGSFNEIGIIYEIDTSLNIVGSFVAPATIGEEMLAGMTWDGTALISQYNIPNYMYFHEGETYVGSPVYNTLFEQELSRDTYPKVRFKGVKSQAQDRVETFVVDYK